MRVSPPSLLIVRSGGVGEAFGACSVPVAPMIVGAVVAFDEALIAVFSTLSTAASRTDKKIGGKTSEHVARRGS